MAREASEMSVSPTVNRLKPPPVPDTPTLTRTLGWILLNSSATASLMGKTVLEPSISTVPLRLEDSASSSPEHAISSADIINSRRPITLPRPNQSTYG